MGVSVRHNARLAAIVALLAAVMTVAWFARALQSGSALDWFWCVLVAAVGVLQLLVVRDGRAPLMLADEHGVRVRRGETWSGLRWQDIEHVEVQSPGSWLRDGQIVVHPRAEETVAADDEQGDASDPATPSEAYVVRLAATTRVEYDGLTGDLVADLDSLASGRVPVLVLTRMEPEKAEKAEKAGEVGAGREARAPGQGLALGPARRARRGPCGRPGRRRGSRRRGGRAGSPGRGRRGDLGRRPGREHQTETQTENQTEPERARVRARRAGP